MKLKLLSLAGAVLMALASQSFAGDIYRINNPNSLVTANRGDLDVFMALNARHMKQAVRDLYHRLEAQGALFNLQTGTTVEVTMYYNDGTAKIEWGNGAFRGFINKEDLASFVGSNNPAKEAPDPKPTPEIAAQAPTPAPATETRPVVNREPVHATTNPVKIDRPTDLTPRESALLTDKEAVMHYFDDFFKRTRPDFSVADSSLFMEVQIGAYNYLVAKIAMNTPSGATLEQGFVIDMKNEYCTVLNLDAYHEFMHTGNIYLLGEKHLNPLED